MVGLMTGEPRVAFNEHGDGRELDRRSVGLLRLLRSMHLRDGAPQRGYPFDLIHDGLEGGSQFVLATHSPLLMRMPGAIIYELGDHGIHSCDFDELAVVKLWRRFLAAPERLLDILLSDDD